MELMSIYSFKKIIKNVIISTGNVTIYDDYFNGYYYINHDNNYTTMHYRLKKGLNKNWTYQFLYNGNINILNVKYDL